MAHWLSGWRVSWRTGRKGVLNVKVGAFPGGLGNLVGVLAGWLARWQVGWRAGGKGVLNDKVEALSAGLAGRLAGWLAGWLAGGAVRCVHGQP